MWTLLSVVGAHGRLWGPVCESGCATSFFCGVLSLVHLVASYLRRVPNVCGIQTFQGSKKHLYILIEPRLEDFGRSPQNSCSANLLYDSPFPFENTCSKNTHTNKAPTLGALGSMPRQHQYLHFKFEET